MSLNTAFPANFEAYVENRIPQGCNPNVLSLCGGGVKGVLTANILAEIEKRVGQKAGKIFDVMAGASVGAIILAGISLRDPHDPEEPQYSARQVADLVEEKMSVIFSNTISHEIESIGGLVHAKYTRAGMSKTLSDLCGDTLFKDLRGNYTIPGFYIGDFTHSSFHFTSVEARSNQVWSHLKLTDVLEATSAAPTYFPAKEITLDKKYFFIDGGTMENNPAPRAYAYAKKLFNCGDDMTLVGIGSGLAITSVTEQEDWGDLEFLPDAVPTIFSGQESTASSLAQDLLGDNFYHIQPVLAQGYQRTDDASPEYLKYLKDTAQAWVEENEEFLENLTQKLSLRADQNLSLV